MRDSERARRVEEGLAVDNLVDICTYWQAAEVPWAPQALFVAPAVSQHHVLHVLGKPPPFEVCA